MTNLDKHDHDHDQNDGEKFDPAAFIKETTEKLQGLHAAVHEALTEALTDPGPTVGPGRPTGRKASNERPRPTAAMLESAARWLKANSFTLPEIKARYPHADPEARKYGAAGRPPVFGASAPFDLDDLDLSKFQED